MFNESKYKKIFEQRYGAGSFDSSLSSARSIGHSKAQAEYEKDQFELRKKAYEQLLKEQQKAEEARIKRESESMNDYIKQNEKAKSQGRGGSMPSREQQEKEADIQAEYKRTGKFPSAIQKDIDNLQYGNWQKLGGQKDAIKSFLDQSNNQRYRASLQSSSNTENVKKKDNDDSWLENLKGFMKGEKVIEGFSIRDKKDGDSDTTINKTGKVREGEKATGLDRFINRAANSTTLGAYEEIAKKTNDEKTLDAFYSDRKVGQGGATDFLADSLGYLLPGLGAVKAVRGTKLGADMSKKGAQKAIQLGKEGAVTGAGIATGEVGVREALNGENTNALENLKHIGIGTAAGALADPALYGIGKGIQPLIGRLAKGDVPTFTGKPSEETVRNLAPKSDSLRLQTNEVRNSNDFSEHLIKNISPNTQQSSKNQFEAISQGKEPTLKRIPDILLDSQKQAEGNANTFRAKVDRTPQKEENTFFSTLRTQFVDDVAPLETLEKKIIGNVASAEDSLYKQARLYKGSPAKAEQLVKEQLYPIIKEVQDKGYNLEDLGDYAIAVHAKDVNAKGINSGFTNAEVEDVINKLGSPGLENARKQLMNVNNNVLEMLSNGEKPVLSADAVKAMREKYPNYMPLFRSFDDEKIEFANGLSNALSVASSPIKKLKGSSRDVVDPMESVIKNIYKATNVVDRNNVASKLEKLADKDIDGHFIRKLDEGEDTGRINVISAMDNGKKVNYEVPPDVYKAMKNLDKESSNTLIKILAKPASTLRAGATLTPEFSMRNFLRDVPAATIVSESGFNPFIDFPVGLWQSIWKGRTIKIGDKEFKTSGDLYEQFIKENGGYGNIMSMDRDAHQQTLKKALTEANTQYIDVLDSKSYKALMKKFANPMDTLRTLADISETGTKVGEFRAAMRKGASPQEAAYRARDIMDFGRAGVSIREANKVVAFLNANIQGKSKLWRAFSQNPGKVSGKAMAMVTIPTIGAIVAQEMFANERQKEVLDDAPTWLKDTFYLVPIPGTNQIARIPKPFDLAYPFSNSLERAFEFVAKNDKETFDGFIKDGFSAMAVPTMLTGLAPMVEGMANYSFFRQGSIIPQREQNMEFPDQHDINTSETAKLLGKGINQLTGGEGSFKNFGSPRIVDNTIQGFTGGLGTYGTSIIDMFINGVSDKEQPEKPAKSIDQQPLAKAFLVNQSGSSKSLDKFYDLRDKLSKARGSAKQNDKEFANEVQYKKSNDLNKGISDLNKEIRTVQNSPTLSSQEKKEQLDKLIRERNKAANEAVNILKKME
ncbi:LPD38 domain-containing protein [Bacillus sp. J37]|uniref:LPD38 domain-containing protein n=1 Tax=Bacillus sp. J37 TaxID=935837 RepID=UPI00047BAEB6|nr:LPD38 domain-containing protein [Bacillus sp. J37]